MALQLYRSGISENENPLVLLDEVESTFESRWELVSCAVRLTRKYGITTQVIDGREWLYRFSRGRYGMLVSTPHSPTQPLRINRLRKLYQRERHIQGG